MIDRVLGREKWTTGRLTVVCCELCLGAEELGRGERERGREGGRKRTERGTKGGGDTCLKLMAATDGKVAASGKM